MIAANLRVGFSTGVEGVIESLVRPTVTVETQTLYAYLHGCRNAKLTTGFRGEPEPCVWVPAKGARDPMKSKISATAPKILAAEIAALSEATTADLKNRWRALYGTEWPPASAATC